MTDIAIKNKMLQEFNTLELSLIDESIRSEIIGIKEITNNFSKGVELEQENWNDLMDMVKEFHPEAFKKKVSPKKSNATPNNIEDLTEEMVRLEPRIAEQQKYISEHGESNDKGEYDEAWEQEKKEAQSNLDRWDELKAKRDKLKEDAFNKKKKAKPSTPALTRITESSFKDVVGMDVKKFITDYQYYLKTNRGLSPFEALQIASKDKITKEKAPEFLAFIWKYSVENKITGKLGFLNENDLKAVASYISYDEIKKKHYNITKKDTIKTLSQIASKDQLNPRLTGIFVGEGHLVSTDAHLLIKHNTDVSKWEKGRIINLKPPLSNKYLDEGIRFPDYNQVIPSDIVKSTDVDIENIYSVLNSYYQFFNKVKTEKPIVVNIDNHHFNLSILLKGMKVLLELGITRASFNYGEKTTSPLTVKSNGSLLLIMGLETTSRSFKFHESEVIYIYKDGVKHIPLSGKERKTVKTTTTTKKPTTSIKKLTYNSKELIPLKKVSLDFKKVDEEAKEQGFAKSDYWLVDGEGVAIRPSESKQTEKEPVKVVKRYKATKKITQKATKKTDDKPKPTTAPKPSTRRKVTKKVTKKPTSTRRKVTKKVSAPKPQDVKVLLRDAREKKMTKTQVIALGKKIHKIMRTTGQIKIDVKKTHKTVLEPTVDNLAKWSNNPRRYDVRGVDVAKDAKEREYKRKPKSSWFDRYFA